MLNKLKFIVKVLFQFAISISLTIIVLLLIVNNTIIKEDYILVQLDKHQFYDKFSQSIQDEILNYTVQSGLEEDVLTNLFTQEKVEITFKNMLHAFYSNEPITIDSTEFRTNLKTNIENYLTQNNIAIADETTLNQLIDQIVNVYVEEYQFSGLFTKFESQFNKLIVYSHKLLKIMIIILVSLFLISLIGFKRLFIAAPVLTLSLFFFLLYYFIINRIDINNITIYDDNISGLIHLIIYDILGIIKQIAISSLGLGLFISLIKGIIFSYFFSLKDKNKQVNKNKLPSKHKFELNENLNID